MVSTVSGASPAPAHAECLSPHTDHVEHHHRNQTFRRVKQTCCGGFLAVAAVEFILAAIVSHSNGMLATALSFILIPPTMLYMGLWCARFEYIKVNHSSNHNHAVSMAGGAFCFAAIPVVCVSTSMLIMRVSCYNLEPTWSAFPGNCVGPGCSRLTLVDPYRVAGHGPLFMLDWQLAKAEAEVQKWIEERDTPDWLDGEKCIWLGSTKVTADGSDAIWARTICRSKGWSLVDDLSWLLSAACDLENRPGVLLQAHSEMRLGGDDIGANAKRIRHLLQFFTSLPGVESNKNLSRPAAGVSC